MQEFFQSRMDSVILSEPNTPAMPRSRHASHNRDDVTTPFQLSNNFNNLNVITSNLSPNLNQNIPNTPNAAINDKRATRYDYLDYGNYINKILSTQLLTFATNNGANSSNAQSGGDNGLHIDWSFKHTQSKVDVVNLILQLIDNRAMFQNLLTQSRDSMDQLKRQIHDSEMKIQSLQQANKEITTKYHQTQQRYQLMQADHKKEMKEAKSKLKELSKEFENLKYRDKKHEHDIRKKEKMMRDLQERVKKLLDDKEKKQHKMIGMKLLNQVKTGVFNKNNNHSGNSANMSMHSSASDSNNNDNSGVRNGSRRVGSAANVGRNQVHEQQNQMAEENNLLQSQVAHLQQQISHVMQENLQLRQTLLELETKCKDTFNKVTNVMISLSEESSVDVGTFGANSIENDVNNINSRKYGMPFEMSETLIRRDVKSSVDHLEKALNQVKTNINNGRIIGANNESMEQEMNRMKSQINELTQQNKEYEKLIRVYVRDDSR